MVSGMGCHGLSFGGLSLQGSVQRVMGQQGLIRQRPKQLPIFEDQM